MENNIKKVILAEKENKVLLKINDTVKIGNKDYKTVRYEIWFDKEKMDQDIPSECINGEQYIYCQGFCGNDEEQMLEHFNSL